MRHDTIHRAARFLMVLGLVCNVAITGAIVWVLFKYALPWIAEFLRLNGVKLP